jgi:hypothetical protein
MDFIFMLTRNDKTVSDCVHVIDLIEPLGLRHIGFKDVGVTEASAGELVNRIKASGATSYMEVVAPHRKLRTGRSGRPPRSASIGSWAVRRSRRRCRSCTQPMPDTIHSPA